MRNTEQQNRFTLLHGDCLERLRELPDNSIDSVVTDPPYGLSDHKPAEVSACLNAWLSGLPYKGKGKGFMGKSWDAWVPGPEVWRECLRVLKPGGHILAFAGTRSMDLMSMAIRLAGFELRDSIGYAHDGGGAPLMAWAYGSGFPKSMDVSKAIDKAAGRIESGESVVALKKTLVDLFDASGKTRKVIDEECGFRACNYLTLPQEGKRPDPWVNVLPSQEKWATIKRVLGCEADIADRLDALFYRAEREVIGQQTKARSTAGASALPTMGGETVYQTWDITAPATDAARQWEGWGTALKPAFEPIILARKPIEGTVAQNVQAHGTGALNIDGCRIPPTGERLGGGGEKRATFSDSDGWSRPWMNDPEHAKAHAAKVSANVDRASELGRWPANLLHDGSDAVLAMFPANAGAAAPVKGTEASKASVGVVTGERDRVPGAFHSDTGSAARFFYCAKASRRDRHEGLDNPGPQFTQGTTLRNVENADTKGNNHPTVKPTDLMRYLCRLVTPPGGTVLDPFMGSGSTGKAAMYEGFRFVGIEMSAEYLEIARARIAYAVEQAAKAAADDSQQDLFGESSKLQQAGA